MIRERGFSKSGLIMGFGWGLVFVLGDFEVCKVGGIVVVLE